MNYGSGVSAALGRPGVAGGGAFRTSACIALSPNGRTTANARNMSTTCNTRMQGSMNSPAKNQMHTSVFYIPRNDETVYENKLIANHLEHERRQFIKKNEMGQLSTAMKDQLQLVGILPRVGKDEDGRGNHHQSNMETERSMGSNSRSKPHSEDRSSPRAVKRGKKKLNPFDEFDAMIRAKYDLSADMYDDMPPKKRNKKLESMLED